MTDTLIHLYTSVEVLQVANPRKVKHCVEGSYCLRGLQYSVSEPATYVTGGRCCYSILYRLYMEVLLCALSYILGCVHVRDPSVIGGVGCVESIT